MFWGSFIRTPFICALRCYHLDRDVESIAVSPKDDRYIVLQLNTGLSFRWRIDGEVRNWVESLQHEHAASGLDSHVRDTLHCWQPHMQGQHSSCFFYALQHLPHMAINVQRKITNTDFLSHASRLLIGEVVLSGYW